MDIKDILGYLNWISFLGYDLQSYPNSQKISLNILAYPYISFHILSYPEISSGANSQMPLQPSGRAAPRRPSCSSAPCAWLCSTTKPGAIHCSCTLQVTSSSWRASTACPATSRRRCLVQSVAHRSVTGLRCWPRPSAGFSPSMPSRLRPTPSSLASSPATLNHGQRLNTPSPSGRG